VSNYRRLARVAYLALFVGLTYGTDLLPPYSLGWWVGVGGLVLVFFDAVICARRRWRVLRREMDGEEGNQESDPTC
jgi:hypothetical protein